jgi:hypothetical protein
MQSIDRLVRHSITRLKRAERKVSPALIGVSETRHLHRRKGENQIKKKKGIIGT